MKNYASALHCKESIVFGATKLPSVDQGFPETDNTKMSCMKTHKITNISLKKKNQVKIGRKSSIHEGKVLLVFKHIDITFKLQAYIHHSI